LPRGRAEETPQEAKRVSENRIFQALAAKHDGLRFNELKQMTGLHQDTLSNRLRELVAIGAVGKVKRTYQISPMGLWERDKRELLYYIEKTKSHVIILPGESSQPVKNVIYPSITGYAFPAVPPPFLKRLATTFHEQLFCFLVDSLIEDKLLEPDFLRKEFNSKHFKQLSQAVKSTSFNQHHLVFAFKVDLKTLLKHLNLDYLNRIRKLSTMA